MPMVGRAIERLVFGIGHEDPHGKFIDTLVCTNFPRDFHNIRCCDAEIRE
jgi:hypothetical protein